MIRKANAIRTVVLLAAVSCNFAQGQSPSPTTLVIDLQNVVSYHADVSDPLKFATNPNVTPAANLNNFVVATMLGDIVAVNGQPAKGTYVSSVRGLSASPAPRPGGAIADITRTAVREDIFEILQSDGTAVGTIMSLGFSGGSPPPGTPSTELIRGSETAKVGANWSIIGGTGAFLGARGQVSGTGGAAREASMAEDPANRRTNGGGAFPFIIHVIPMFSPQISATPAGPAVTHSSDFTLVSASKAAAPGEILSLFATGLGPTVPSVDFGQPFPSSPAAAVNSPITVTVNGTLRSSWLRWASLAQWTGIR